MRISDLERRSGVKRRTIHYYMSEGLLSSPKRTGKTMAYYSSVHAEELGEIRRMQKEGYPLSLVKELMNARRNTLQSLESGSKSDRKRQLVERAVEIFSRKGYSQTRISDITGAVGVGQSTFYLYFPGKKALFIECVDKVFQTMFQDVWEEIKHEKHPLRRLLKRGRIVLKSHPQFVDMLLLLSIEVENDPVLEIKRKEIYASIFETIRRDLEGAARVGLLRPEPSEEDIEVLSYILIGFVETAALIMSMNPQYSVDSLLKAALQLTRFKLVETDYKDLLEG